uniref:Zinc finger, CCHC-type n=1 Tax=Tanacetum cinerariifolium TaxID=118510 RepID=A0A6L2MPB3_TANCI|nr:zinc finger, CCHC-type [Tanacetum cinerariifolium]
MKEDETINTFTKKLTTLVNKAASLGHTMEDETLVRKLLNVVPDKYLQIVSLIEQYSDLSEMKIEEAIGRLKTYEERIKYKQDNQMNIQESLMFTQHEGKRKPFREYGHGRFNQSRGREQEKNDYQSKREVRASFEEDTRDKTSVTCYRCHKLGHYANECSNKCKNQQKITESAEITKSAEIAESAEAAENAEDSKECRKFQKLINVTVSVKGSKDEDK